MAKFVKLLDRYELPIVGSAVMSHSCAVCFEICKEDLPTSAMVALQSASPHFWSDTYKTKDTFVFVLSKLQVEHFHLTFHGCSDEEVTYLRTLHQ